MEQGWIYVLVNSSIPGMVKVGRTSRPSSERVAELSAATGVATPFVLAFDQPTHDCNAAEKAVHDELDRRGLRVAGNREFFWGPASDIIRVVLEVADDSGHGPAIEPDRSAASLLATADRCLFGLGDTLQDVSEAIRLYKLAASRGATLAFERLGQVYGELYATQGDRASRRRALTPLKEGARRGNHHCYAEMASLYACERHVGNFVKAWDMFFAIHPATEPAREEPRRFAAACCRYVGNCLDLGLDPGYRDILRSVCDTMITALLAELDILPAATPSRRRVMQVLRWTYQTLLRWPISTMREPSAALVPMPWLQPDAAVMA